MNAREEACTVWEEVLIYEERYKLYKFYFPIQSDSFVRRAIYSVAYIFETSLIEGQIVKFERTYCQPDSVLPLYG